MLLLAVELFRYAAPHLWNKLPTTLCVPYQFNPSSSPSSSPSSYSDLGPFVDFSGCVFHSRLKLLMVNMCYQSVNDGAAVFSLASGLLNAQGTSDMLSSNDVNDGQ